MALGLKDSTDPLLIFSADCTIFSTNFTIFTEFKGCQVFSGNFSAVRQG